MKNKEFDTPLDFDNVSKNIAELTIGKFKFIFNIPKLLEIVNEDRQDVYKRQFHSRQMQIHSDEADSYAPAPLPCCKS